ncbi:carboxylesterase/lipase family protein [Microbacterium sp. SLBN-146]|uniref:carboxylesterase/lipase family protein n=1 Tax=Microbacterium sp. SLBN-146 TaxID=2768457 RepID=UPI001152F518|nr:carboxylesterase family protein [Microbacterium sp. SLBN-146]TQJ30403.1 para-nitrobenzyl esterase [Microbacterium sp. SLBN-146]
MARPSAPIADTSESVQVDITTGMLRGIRAGGIDRFRGIPFAAPPVGPRRFAAPERVDAWEGVRPALDFGPTAPQSPYRGELGELLTCPVIEGDDVLTVNVWSPTDAAARPAPVILWLHGGALERGTSAQSGYDGTTFARDGVVFVSANYRLGVEGFSVLDGAPRNLGLLDVAFALEWVYREIAAFGGDPSRITLMGESAGGALVAALVARPASRALVAGAIIQSGPLEASTEKKARRASDAIAERLGIPATREAFARIPPDELLRARSEIAAGSSPLRGSPGFALAIDPASLPTSPDAALVEAEVPILIGTNTDEYRLWLTPAAIAEIGPVKAWLARRVLRIPERAARAARRALPEASPGEVVGQLLTDKILRAPATRLARSRRAPTYVYEFAWPSPIRDLRAAHALEIAFAFDNLDDEEALRLSGPDAPTALAHDMHAAWVAFARTGHPGWTAFGRDRMTHVWNDTTQTHPQRRAAVVDALG